MATQYDITSLPKPELINVITFEETLANIEAEFLQLNPTYAGLIVESDPIKKVLETWAYDRMNWVNHVNETARQTMLTYATGTNLDQRAASTATPRLMNGNEPETDEAFRYRAQHAPEKFTVAGPIGAYEQYALSVDGNIMSASVLAHTPAPGYVTVLILSYDNDGEASMDLCDEVRLYLSAEERRPLLDQVHVHPPRFLDKKAVLKATYFNVADKEKTNDLIIESLAYLSELNRYEKRANFLFKPGEMLTLNAIHDAARVTGIQNIHILALEDDIIPAKDEAIRLTVEIIDGGYYE